jgi:hypothetical protein
MVTLLSFDRQRAFDGTIYIRHIAPRIRARTSEKSCLSQSLPVIPAIAQSPFRSRRIVNVTRSTRGFQP